MPNTIETLHKLSKEIESDIEHREKKWTAKYKSLKKDVKQWKKKAKHEKEMTRVLQRENERLWEFIFSRSLQMKTVDIPALGKKEIVDLVGDDDIPCVTPSKESDSSTVIKCESIDGDDGDDDVDDASVEKTENVVVEKEVVVEEEEEEEEEVVVEEEEEEVVVEEEEEVVEEEEKEEEEEVVDKKNVVEAEAEDEEAEDEEAEDEEAEEEEAEEEELFEVEIDGVDYYTSSEVNGLIYEKKANGEVGEELGYFEDSEPGFYE